MGMDKQSSEGVGGGGAGKVKIDNVLAFLTFVSFLMEFTLHYWRVVLNVKKRIHRKL